MLGVARRDMLGDEVAELRLDALRLLGMFEFHGGVLLA
jgi:hypothetical protein